MTKKHNQSTLTRYLTCFPQHCWWETSVILENSLEGHQGHWLKTAFSHKLFLLVHCFFLFTVSFHQQAVYFHQQAEDKNMELKTQNEQLENSLKEVVIGMEKMTENFSKLKMALWESSSKLDQLRKERDDATLQVNQIFFLASFKNQICNGRVVVA